MDRYLTLDLSNKNDALYFGNKFLDDRDYWKKQIRKKNRELQSVSEIKGISNSEVHSGAISKPTENVAIAKMQITEQIKRYEDYEYILTYALNNISEESRDIITAFHYTKGRYINSIVDELAAKYGCETRTVYNKRRTAVLEFVEAVRELINA